MGGEDERGSSGAEERSGERPTMTLPRAKAAFHRNFRGTVGLRSMLQQSAPPMPGEWHMLVDVLNRVVNSKQRTVASAPAAGARPSRRSRALQLIT